MSVKCRIIAIEGLDGVGKETMVMNLMNHFSKEGKKVKAVSFPRYDTKYGKIVSELTHGHFGDPIIMDPYLMGSSYTLDRIDYFKNEIDLDQVMEEYDYLLMDRSYFSNFMYQAPKIAFDMVFSFDEYGSARYVLSQYVWEFIYTGLDKYLNNIRIFILRMSENDRELQMQNRLETDMIEDSGVYMLNVDNFLNMAIMRFPEVMDMNYDSLVNADQTNANIGERAFQAYYANVVPITIQHYTSENKDEITKNNIDSLISAIEKAYK